MRYAIIRSLLLLVLVTGCDSSWRARFPIGTKLYETNNHQYFGQVVAYENSHDFRNGTDPCPACDRTLRGQQGTGVGQLRDLRGDVRGQAALSSACLPMAYKISIEIDASLQDSWLISRILNCKEEIHREFLRSGHAIITDPAAVDRALSPLDIMVASKRLLGGASAIITKAIQHHEVTHAIRVFRTS